MVNSSVCRGEGPEKRVSSLRILERIFVGLLLVIFGGIIVHAPLTVGLGTLFPSYELVIKMWKEVLMLLAVVLVVVILYQKKQLKIMTEPLMVGIGIYGLLHLLLLPIFWQGLTPSMAGLMIDLRYVLFFALVYVAMRLYPGRRRLFVIVGVVGALVALVFAILQVFILPADILKYLGYSTKTIVPYLTVDQNHAFIRINSTFRGPNPLGAYAVIVLSILTAFIVKYRTRWSIKQWSLVGILTLGGIVALWASYSRSALIAAGVGIVTVVAVTIGRKVSRRTWITGSVVLVVLIGGVLMSSRGNSFISNVVLHDNPGGNSTVDSNQGHIESLQTGVQRLGQQPLGAGIGSTGSASLYGHSPLIVENQYLFIAHEAGWLGLILFLLIFVGVLNRLWARRQDYLALGVFASGIGLAFIGLLLPVWVDDTVAIIWWGLAAVALGGKE